MKPGISSAGRPRPSPSPSPRRIGSRSRAAASRPTRASRHSGGREPRGIRDGRLHREHVNLVPRAARFRARAGRDDPGRASSWSRSAPTPSPPAASCSCACARPGLNGADMLQLRGHYPAPPGSPPDIPGHGAGRRGGRHRPRCERFAVGDRVMAVVGGGAQAELAIVHERGACRCRTALDWPAAGGLPEVFTTAHDAIFSRPRCAPASICWCTAPPAGSEPRQCSSAARRARA